MIFSIIAIVFTIVFFNFNNLKCYAADSKVISGIFVNGVWVDRTDSTDSGNTFPPKKKWTVCRWTPSNTPAPVGDWAYAGSLDESEKPLFPNGTFNNDYTDMYPLQIPYDDGTYKGTLIRMSNPGTDYYNFVTPLTPRDGSMQITWSYMSTWYYSGTVSTSDVPVDPIPTPTIKPTVTLNAPSTVVVGDDAYLSATGTSTEPTVTSIQTIVSVSGGNGSIPTGQAAGKSSTATGSVWFSTPGTYTATAVAIDSNNAASDSVTKQINVINPTPIIHFVQTGTLKENRKVTLDMSSSYGGSKRATINWSTSRYVVTALNGSSISDVRIQNHTIGSTNGTIIYDPSKGINNTLNGLNIFDMTFKKAGQYQVQCTLSNDLGFSSTSNTILTIIQDVVPSVGFSVPSIGIRDHFDANKYGGLAYGIWTTTDSGTGTSGNYSTDGDAIEKIAWFYIFDFNNNGSYLDDKCYVYNASTLQWQYIGTYSNIVSFDLDSVSVGNLHTVSLETTHDGDYYFGCKIREAFGQEYIPQFVNTADKKINTLFY